MIPISKKNSPKIGKKRLKKWAKNGQKNLINLTFFEKLFLPQKPKISEISTEKKIPEKYPQKKFTQKNLKKS